MRKTMRFLLLPVALLAAFGGCDVQSLIKDVGNAAAPSLLVPDTHEALYDAMLACQESYLQTLEGISNAQSAQGARPQLLALAKRYRALSHRYLMLGLPDEAEAKHVVERFAERESRMRERGLELGKRLTAGDKELILAVMESGGQLVSARMVFEARQAALRSEKARGQSGGTVAEDISEHEKALARVAASLNKLADMLRTAGRQASQREHQQVLQNHANELVSEVNKFAKLPALKQVKSAIRLDPAQEPILEAHERFTDAMHAAKGDSQGSLELTSLDLKVMGAVFKLQIAFRDFGSKVGAPAWAGGPPPGQPFSWPGPMAVLDGPPRPAPSAGVAEGTLDTGARSRFGIPNPPPPLEGPDVATIIIEDLPADTYNRLTQKLREICNSNSFQAQSVGSRYVFRVRPVDDIVKLAAKIDFGTVTQVDSVTRTITLKIDAAKLWPSISAERRSARRE